MNKYLYIHHLEKNIIMLLKICCRNILPIIEVPLADWQESPSNIASIVGRSIFDD